MAKAMDKLDAVKAAANYSFYNGLNCCESVYEALIASGALSEKDAPYHTCSMCAGFGGGGGMAGYTCGALSGAILGVSAKHGRKDPKNDKPDGLYDIEYRRYNNMMYDFKNMMGSVLCKEICVENKHDWGGKARKDHCAKAVAAAVEIACRYIDLTTADIAKLSWKDNMAGN